MRPPRPGPWGLPTEAEPAARAPGDSHREAEDLLLDFGVWLGAAWRDNRSTPQGSRLVDLSNPTTSMQAKRMRKCEPLHLPPTGATCSGGQDLLGACGW